MRLINGNLLAVFLSVQIVLLTTPATADDKAEAKKHFKTGTALYKSEDYQGAVAEFKVSVDLYPTKNGMFNLANCYKALHRYADALAVIDRMKTELGKQLDSQMRQKVEGLEQEIRALLATLRIRVNEAGSTVALDGREIGKSPLSEPVLVGPGEHTVQVSLDGFFGEERKVAAVSGETFEITLKLKPVRTVLTISANAEGASVVVDGNEVGKTPLQGPIDVSPGEHIVSILHDDFDEAEKTVKVGPGAKLAVDFSLVEKNPEPAPLEREPVAEDDKSAEEKGKKKGLPAMFWVGLAGTALTGAASGVFYGLAANEHGKLQSTNGNLEDLNADPPSDYDEKYDDLYAEAETYSTRTEIYQYLGLGLGIGAGAFAATTVISLIVGLSGEESEGAIVSAVPGGISVSF